MTTTTPRTPRLHEILEISYTTYDNYREKHYQAYCQRLATLNFMSYKTLHTNGLMQNYFHGMWLLHVEKAFLQDNAHYFSYCEAELLRQLFCSYTRNILDNEKVQMYPSKLIVKMKKLSLKKLVN